MTTFVPGPVRVRVPATSANLGPGFDSLGLALTLHDELEAEITGDGVDIEVTGEGADEVPRDQTHLVIRAMCAAFDLTGTRPAGLRLRCHNVIPHSRGLGSSSAAIVAGVVLARGLVAGGGLLLDDAALLDLAADLEGHPDNVAPALLGGFTIAGREAGEWYAVPAGVDPRIGAVAFVPPDGVRTELARGLLPESVPHADAAANAGRAALLVAALASRPEHLLTATRDWLHQDQRAEAMPASLALIGRLRERGIPAVVSGAGPTVLAFTGTSQTRAAHDVAGHAPRGWAVHRLDVEPRGAVLL